MQTPASMISRAKSGSSNHSEKGLRNTLRALRSRKGGREAIVAGLSRYAGRRLQAHPNDGMEA
jgi:hypothetical protein